MKNKPKIFTILGVVILIVAIGISLFIVVRRYNEGTKSDKQVTEMQARMESDLSAQAKILGFSAPESDIEKTCNYIQDEAIRFFGKPNYQCQVKYTHPLYYQSKAEAVEFSKKVKNQALKQGYIESELSNVEYGHYYAAKQDGGCGVEITYGIGTYANQYSLSCSTLGKRKVPGYTEVTN